MSNTQSAQEPSMEEILASIRKIISEDDGGGASNELKSGQQEAESRPAANGFGAFGAPSNSASNPAQQARPNGIHGDGETAVVDAPKAPVPPPTAGFTPAATAFGQPAAKSEAAPPQSGNGAYAPGGEFEGVPGQDGEDEEVLDLTEMVASDGRVVKITPQGLSNGQANGESHEAPAPGGFGASFGQAAQAEAGHADPHGAEATPEGYDAVHEAGTQESAVYQEADTGAGQGGDHVSYSQADLDGTPAYMAAHGAQQPAAPAVNSTGASVPPPAAYQHSADEDDAFAELAGTEKPETITQDTNAMTDSSHSLDTATGGTEEQHGFGRASFGGAAGNMAGDMGAGLEAIVRQTADPMIRQWIEQNMPDIVERLVREEVARRLAGNG